MIHFRRSQVGLLLMIFGAVSLLASVSLSWSWRGSVRAVEEPPALIVDESGLVAPVLRPLQEAELSVGLKNVSTAVVHVVGAKDWCGLKGCVETYGLPIELPPGTEKQVKVHYRAGHAGDFVLEFSLFTDVPGQSVIPLHVTGRVAGE